MTELEHLLKTKKDMFMATTNLCCLVHICKYNKNCAGKSCDECEIYGNLDLCNEILLAEHKESIKLLKWERDLIATNDQSHERAFNSFATYKNMKNIGYFKGITDTSMTLREILDNCEVISD